MNLHNVVRAAIGAVNPDANAVLYLNGGYNTNPDGTRVPNWGAPILVTAQVQALSASTLAQLDGQNIQGVVRSAYLYGDIEGIRRIANKGGDLLSYNGSFWLVAQVVETWDQDGWCHIVITEQADLAAP